MSKGKNSWKKSNNSQEGTSNLVIPFSPPTTSSSLHGTQGGDDGEDPDRKIDLVLACELNEVTGKKRSKSKEKVLNPIQKMIDECLEVNALPSSFVYEMIQSIASPTCSSLPTSVEGTQELPLGENTNNQDFSPTILQVSSMIDSSTTISTSWLQQSLERKKKRVIQLEAPNLISVANLVHKGTKVKKTRIDSRLEVYPTSRNLFVKIAQPVIEKNIDEVDEADFNITQVDLG